MESVLKSLTNLNWNGLTQQSRDYIDLSMSLLLDESNKEFFSKMERDSVQFISDTFKDTSSFMSEDYLVKNKPEVELLISRGHILNANDLYIHVKKLLDRRSRLRVQERLSELTSKISKEGFTDEIKDEIDSLYRIGKPHEEQVDLQKPASLLEKYEDKCKSPGGIVTGIAAIDEVTGGLSKAQVGVLFGYVGAYKSSLAINMAYKNSYKHGKNVVYISLEMAKEDILWDLISRHSFESKFPKYNYIAHDKIRKCKLSEDEKHEVFDVIYPDLVNNSAGKLVILDETDFKTFAKSEIKMKLEDIDREMPGGLDCVFWDQASLFKYSGDKKLDQNAIINDYVSFIRQMSLSFSRDEHGNPKQLAMVVLAQANREGWKRAVKNNGQYDLRAISEANELERAATIVWSIFNDEILKESKEAKISVLKSRYGSTMLTPQVFFADPVSFCFGEELQGFSESISVSDLDNLFGSGDFSGILDM